MSLHLGYRLTQKIRHDIYPSIAVDRSDLAFDGRCVLITGGGSGIGLATAKAFAQAGASTVIIVGRGLDKLKVAADEIEDSRAGVRVIALAADVSNPTSITKLWEEVNETVGKVDVLVNNAGRGGDVVLIGDGAVEDWWSVQQTNILGTYAMTDAYLDSLAASDEEGTIINVVSAAALFEQAGSSAYSISKFATIKLTQFVHAESPHVRAFSVHPGIVPTELAKDMGDQAHDTAELAAAFNLYLASSRADYLRGRFVTANWDVEEMEAHQDQITSGKLLQFGIHADLGSAGITW